MNIALKLQELLESRGVSRSKLARAIGVHTSTVSNWLDGRDVKSENLATLCTYFDCSLDYLTGTTSGIEKAPTQEGERQVSNDEIKAAFFEGAADLSKEEMDLMWNDAKDYIQYKLEQRRRKRND